MWAQIQYCPLDPIDALSTLRSSNIIVQVPQQDNFFINYINIGNSCCWRQETHPIK